MYNLHYALFVKICLHFAYWFSIQKSCSTLSNSKNLFVDVFGNTVYTIIGGTNNTSVSSFLILSFLFFFFFSFSFISCLTVLAKTTVQEWIKEGIAGILLFAALGRSCPHLTIRYNVYFRVLVDNLYQIREVPFYSKFAECFFSF